MSLTGNSITKGAATAAPTTTEQPQDTGVGGGFVDEAAGYVGEQLANLIKRLASNLITGIPEATFELIDGKPGAALVTLGGAVGGPLARLVVETTADGVIKVSTEAGELIVDGLTSEEAAEFAKWVKKNGGELASLSLAEIKEKWSSRDEVTGTEFTNVTVGGKTYSVTHEFPPLVIDDNGEILDAETDKRKIRNIMAHVPYFRETDKLSLSELGLPTSGDEWQALLLGAANGFTFGAVGYLSPNAQKFLDKHPKQAAVGEVLSSIYGPGLAAKAILWGIKFGRNARVLKELQKAVKSGKGSPQKLYDDLGDLVTIVKKSSDDVLKLGPDALRDIQEYRGKIKSAMSKWERAKGKAGSNRQKLGELFDDIFDEVTGHRPGGVIPSEKIVNPFTGKDVVKGPWGSKPAVSIKGYADDAAHFRKALTPTLNYMTQRLNMAVFDFRYIVTEIGIATFLDFANAATDFHRQGLSPQDAVFQALLRVGVDLGENVASEILQVAFPSQASVIADGLANSISELAGYGSGYTKEGLTRLSQTLEDGAAGGTAPVETNEEFTDANIAAARGYNMGGLIYRKGGGDISKKVSMIYREGYTAPGQAYAIAKSKGYNLGGLIYRK